MFTRTIYPQIAKKKIFFKKIVPLSPHIVDFVSEFIL